MKSFFVVTGVIIHRGKILILKKSPDDWNYPNTWSFCGGFVKEFEAAEETIVREIREETQLDVRIDGKGKLVVSPDQKHAKQWVCMVFLCKAAGGKIVLDHENAEYKWVTPQEILSYPFVPGLRESLIAVGKIEK